MPKPETNPIIFDQARWISISEVLEHCRSSEFNQFFFQWGDNIRRRYYIIGELNETNERLKVQFLNASKELIFDQSIVLTSIPSNLGQGEVYYFQCPHTFRNCRKLYLIRGLIGSRHAFPRGMYEQQRDTKRGWSLTSHGRFYREFMRLSTNLFAKHSKLHYRGKPTAKQTKYHKLQLKLQNANKQSCFNMNTYTKTQSSLTI